MRLKNFFKILLAVTFTITSANALKQDEIKEQMTKKIDDVLVVLQKKDLNKNEKRICMYCLPQQL